LNAKSNHTESFDHYHLPLRDAEEIAFSAKLNPSAEPASTQRNTYYNTSTIYKHMF